MWFPGAHADVGGGYGDDDSNELPGISLNWMIKFLGDSYQFATPVPPFPESAVGLARWSIGNYPGNKFSDCVPIVTVRKENPMGVSNIGSRQEKYGSTCTVR